MTDEMTAIYVHTDSVYHDICCTLISKWILCFVGIKIDILCEQLS